MLSDGRIGDCSSVIREKSKSGGNNRKTESECNCVNHCPKRAIIVRNIYDISILASNNNIFANYERNVFWGDIRSIALETKGERPSQASKPSQPHRGVRAPLTPHTHWCRSHIEILRKCYHLRAADTSRAHAFWWPARGGPSLHMGYRISTDNISHFSI